jgi:hypothetical protein
MRQVIAATVFSLLWASAAPAQPAKSIYRLVITGCPGTSTSGRYIQSSFKLAGERVLVTALHGVAGCSSIEAYDSRGAAAFEGRKFKIIPRTSTVMLQSSSLNRSFLLTEDLPRPREIRDLPSNFVYTDSLMAAPFRAALKSVLPTLHSSS